MVEEYRSWLAESYVPKLFINADPGAIVTGRIPRLRPQLAQPELKSPFPGVHFIQEDSPDQIGSAVADFVRSLPAVAG